MTPLLHKLSELFRPSRDEVVQLPVVVVIPAVGEPEPLDRLQGLLDGAGDRRVPYIRVDAGDFVFADLDADAATDCLRRLLMRIAERLRPARYGAARLRFDHLDLLNWVMNQDLTAEEVTAGSRPGELIVGLRDRGRWTRSRARAGEGSVGTAAQSSNSWVSGLAWLLRLAIPMLFRLRVSGRFPLVGGPYRWFLRQPYLTPYLSGTFPMLAERLTVGVRREEAPDQVQRLLVHAFLQDLRRAHLRGSGRPGGRRTAYPMVLLANVEPGGAAATLLQLVNEIRNETGVPDPLLVVASCQDLDTARAVVSQDLKISDARAAFQAVQDWRGWLPGLVRKRAATAWFLPFIVRGQSADELGVPPERYMPDPPPRRRWLAVTAAGLVTLLGAGGAGWVTGVIPPGQPSPTPTAAMPSPSPRCPAPDTDRRRARLEAVDGDIRCIGYSDRDDGRSNPFGTGDTDLAAAQRRVFANNVEVARLARERGQLIYTVVYLGQLTGLPGDKSYGYASDIEELNGIAVAQAARLDPAGPSQPALMRVVIANAGHQMLYATRVADMIVDLAAADPTVVAVIGLVESRDRTGAALRILQEHGIAAIAPTLSADQMTDPAPPVRPSNFYLQIAPTNHAESALIAAYVRDEIVTRRRERRPRVTAVRLYYTTANNPLADDWYVNSLSADLQADLSTLPGGVFDGKARAWSTAATMPCDENAVVVFAGRWNDFGDFLQTLCPTAPMVIADDSVTRFMASDVFRARAKALPVTYVSKGYLSSCDSLAADSHGVRGQFLGRIRSELDACRDDEFALGERVGLAYDATMLLADTIDRLLARIAGRPKHLAPITSMLVYTDIVTQYGIGRPPYDGVTGQLTFTTEGAPVDRAVSLVHVANINQPNTDPEGRPREVYRCGRAFNQPPDCRRP